MTDAKALTLRRLGFQDLARLEALMTVFAEAFEEPETYQAAQPSSEYLKTWLSKDHVIALVALKGEQVVGGLVAYVLEKFEQARSEIFVYDLAVAADHRRQGIATALLEALHPIARDSGAYVIIIQADKGDEAPGTLYSKLGRREEILHFDIEVRGDTN